MVEYLQMAFYLTGIIAFACYICDTLFDEKRKRK